MPLFQILSCVAFSICLFFYLYVIGSFLEITIYPLVNRVTFSTVFQEHIINEYYDNAIVIAAATSWLLFSINHTHIRYMLSAAYGGIGFILAATMSHDSIFEIYAVLSVPFIISVLLYYFKLQHKLTTLNFSANLAWRYLCILVIAVSGISIVYSAISIYFNLHFDAFESPNSNDLYLLLSSFSTFYIFLLILCVPVKVAFREILRTLNIHFKEDIEQQVAHNDDQQFSGTRLSTQTKIGFLLLAMTLSIILVLIPHHPSINEDDQNIGVDTHYYVTWIEELAKSKSISEFAYGAFILQGQDGDRPLSLIVMFLVYQIMGGSLSEVIEYFPLILGPGIVLALYFLTLELVRNEKIALIAALMAGVSIHTLAGIYAGFYANWLALIFGYVSIVFLFRYLRSGYHSHIIIFLVMLIGVLFLHVYTWTIIAAVSGIFLLTMLVLQNLKHKNNNNNNDISESQFNNRRIVWLLLFAILPSVVVDLAKVLLSGSSGGLEQDIELAQAGLGIHQFNLRWEILNVTMHHSLGGVFGNFIILILGLFWVLKSNIRKPGSVFILVFLSAGIVPLFFGSWAIQARVFYDIPFAIPAAIALYYLSTRSGSTMLVSLAACTWLIAASILTVMNYFLVPPLVVR